MSHLSDGPSHWQHPCKCMSCSLHFLACSDHEVWPQPNHPGDAIPICPECGSDALLRWTPHRVEGFIFQAVPGSGREIVQFGAIAS